MTPRQLDILGHTIGHMKDGVLHRNHFVAGEDHKDRQDLEALVASGHMVRQPYHLDEVNHCDLYRCTEAGIRAARGSR